ncbi:MAG: hypothetical protein ABIC68_08175 [Candidatus Omnitrophota bacterium]
MNKQTNQITADTKLLFQDLSLLIDQSKQQLVSAVNNTLEFRGHNTKFWEQKNNLVVL